MKIVQCWDDGVVSDIRLTELLRKYQAHASFNLNAGLHSNKRDHGWHYNGTEVLRLAKSELLETYTGFTIANHTLTHPDLCQLDIADMAGEIIDNRLRLQDWFGQSIDGFAYPFGTHNRAIEDMVRVSGHLYARTVKATDHCQPHRSSMAMQPNCHFLAEDFWQRFELAKAANDDVFYFWGHSYELLTDQMWQNFESSIARISTEPDCEWAQLTDLFASHSEPYA